MAASADQGRAAGRGASPPGCEGGSWHGRFGSVRTLLQGLLAAGPVGGEGGLRGSAGCPLRAVGEAGCWALGSAAVHHWLASLTQA